MNFNEILILGFCIFWQVIAVVFFILVNRLIEKEYRRFYPSPVVGIIKSVKHDEEFSLLEKIFVYTASIIVLLPLSCEWFLGWCMYSLVMKLTELSEQETIVEESATSNKGSEETIESSDTVNQQEETSQITEPVETIKYVYVNNGTVNKRIKEDEIQSYIENGFVKGRIKK